MKAEKPVFPSPGSGNFGLDTRDLIAIMAMQALIARAPVQPSPTDIAMQAYGFADAMVKEYR